jgi:hypothetical protein
MIMHAEDQPIRSMTIITDDYILVGSDSKDFVYEDGDEDTQIGCYHPAFYRRLREKWMLPCHDCIRVIKPIVLSYRSDLFVTSGMSVHNERFYGSDKYLHPICVWSMDPIENRKNEWDDRDEENDEELEEEVDDEEQEDKRYRPKFILSGHDEFQSIIIPIDGKFIAGSARNADKLYLWKLPLKNPEEEDEIEVDGKPMAVAAEETVAVVVMLSSTTMNDQSEENSS